MSDDIPVLIKEYRNWLIRFQFWFFLLLGISITVVFLLSCIAGEEDPAVFLGIWAAFLLFNAFRTWKFVYVITLYDDHMMEFCSLQKSIRIPVGQIKRIRFGMLSRVLILETEGERFRLLAKPFRKLYGFAELLTELVKWNPALAVYLRLPLDFRNMTW